MSPKHLFTPLLLLALAGCSPSETAKPFTQTLGEQVVLPAYSHWQAADRQLAERASALCEGQGDLNDARQAFNGAIGAWSALQPMLVGPMAEGNRAWQVQFWPDKKNLVQRQVEALLTKQPELSAEQLAKSSVVVRGLTAAEYVLFDPELDLSNPEQKARYCPLLKAIGEHQNALAIDILAQWQADESGMLAQLTRFPNERYADTNEALADLLRAQLSAIDGVKKKLALPLGRQSKGIAQPFQAEAWRSESSLNNIKAAISSAQALWQGNAKNGFKSLLNADQQTLAERIDAAYQDTDQRLQQLNQPLTVLLSQEDGREQLNALYDSLTRLHRVQESELAAALGVQIGFNAHDGD